MKKGYLWLPLLLGLLLFHLLINYLWLHEGACLYGKDVMLRLLANKRFEYELKQCFEIKQPVILGIVRLIALFRINLVPGMNVWTIDPKLGHFVYVMIGLILGNSLIDVLLWGNGLWLMLLFVSVYAIGKNILNSATGWWAGFFLSFYPALFGISRKFGLDLPQMAVTSLAILLLIKSNGFRIRWNSSLFGIMGGLGFLIKDSCPIWLVGPWLYSVIFIRSNGEPDKHRGNRIVNCALAIILFLGVTSIWWTSPGFLSVFREYNLTHLTEYAYDSVTPHNLPTPLFYPSYIVESISPFFAFVAIIALFPFLRSRIQDKGIVLSWIIMPLIVLTICRPKWGSWCLAVLPPIALVTAGGLQSITHKNVRNLLMMVVVTLAMLQFWGLSFDEGILTDAVKSYAVNGPYYDWELFQSGLYHVWYHPPEPNNHKMALEYIASAIKPQKYLRIALLERINNWHIEDSYELEYYLRAKCPAFIMYESISVPKAFFPQYRSANYYIVLAPIGQALPLREDYKELSGPEFEELLKVIKGCELVITLNYEPQKFAISLYRRLPVDITKTGLIPAEGFFEGNLFVNHPFVSSDSDLSPTLSDEELDSPWPSRVWERPSSEPYYAIYRLSVERDAMYVFRLKRLEDSADARIKYYFDETSTAAGKPIKIAKGIYELRIESPSAIPHFSGIVLTPVK